MYDTIRPHTRILNRIKFLRQRNARRPRTEIGAADGGIGSYAKGAAKQEEILRGVVAIFVEGKVCNPSLRTIAARVGVEPSHILYYFGSREALLEAVIRRWDEQAAERVDSGSPTATLTLDAYCETIRSNVAIPGIIHLYLYFATEAIASDHPARRFFKERFERTAAGLAAAIRVEQDAGAIAAALDADAKARQLIALADGLQLQSLIDPRVDAASDLADAIATLREAAPSPRLQGHSHPRP